MAIKKIVHNKLILPFLVFLLIIFPRLINFANYPFFGPEEGINTANGWWLINFSKLPYTYWYDHAPFGWLTIGFWQKLTGGPFAFGFSLFSTRIFMTLIAGLTGVIFYKIIENLTKSKTVALVSCVILAFSPLAITYQRRVLLDNLETFWLMLSLWFMLKAKSNLRFILFSGLCFGLSFLSKEAVVFMLPVMAWAAWASCRKENQRYSLMIWLTTALFLISFPPLLALLRQEFFPTGFIDNTKHVSLLETLFNQMAIGFKVKPWEAGSPIWTNIVTWFKKDYILMFLGPWSLAVNLLFNWKDKKTRFIVLLSLSYILFLVWGGLEFYILPLLLLFTINIGLTLAYVKASYKFKLGKLGMLLGLGVVSILLITQELAVYTAKPTQKQLEAVEYIKNNIDNNQFIAIDDFAYTDLKLGDKKFTNAEWFWKVEQDEEIKDKKLKNDWRNISYILLSGEMRRQILQGELPLVSQALVNADLVQDFPSVDLHEQGDIKNLQREGDGWQALFKVNQTQIQKEKETLQLIQNIPLEQRVGMLFMVGIEGQVLDEETSNFIAQNNFTNFLLLQRNIGGETQVKQLIEELKELKGTTLGRDVPLTAMVAVDQEGGSVNRINFGNMDLTPQSEISDPDEAHRIAVNRAGILKNLGINVNLAPVLDIPQSQFSYIGRTNRAFMGEEVVKMAVAMMEEYQKQGIIPVVKHYPFGLGRITVDPHQVLPEVNINQTELGEDIGVLRELGKVKAVLVTHLLYPQIDSQLPSSLSPIFIGEILRGDKPAFARQPASFGEVKGMGFEGLVVTDDLNMGAITRHFSIPDASKLAIKAGADMVIISGNILEQQRAYEAVLGAVKSGEISEERINEAVGRIMKVMNN